jgi:hypothetical protein
MPHLTRTIDPETKDRLMGYFAEMTELQNAGRVPRGAVAITPSDGADLAKPIRGLIVATAGNVSVIMDDGSSAVLPGLKPGVEYMGVINRIKATGTTATGIIGLI